jgi:hypothetical protein
MKAFVYDGASPSGMRWVENALRPSLKAGQVLVTVIACSLNPIDYKKPGIPILGYVLELFRDILMHHTRLI